MKVMRVIMCEKKEKLSNIFNGIKNIAYNAYKRGDYESSLGVISAAAAYMYEINMIYNDSELEKLVEMITKKYINYANIDDKFEIKNILFYDEFGYENRGIASIYIKAMINKGYRVIYVTRSYRRNKISKIEKIVNQNGKIVFLERDSYKNEVEKLVKIIIENKCGNIFMYTFPQGIVAPMCYYVMQKYNVRVYKINLTDHAYWLGNRAADYFIEFRDLGADISVNYRKIDSKKIVKLPFYPEIDKDIEFEGLPFVQKNKKIIFSGGGLYKTFDSEMLYYKIVDDILNTYNDVIFWYAGGGDTSGLEKLEKKYQGRVYHTGERKDLYQVLKRCYFYLGTYPISGGLMGQYAAEAGKVPMQLLHDELGGLLLENVNALECQYNDVNSFMEQIHTILNDERKLSELEAKTKNQVISQGEFEDELESILTSCSTRNIKYQDVELEKFQKVYLERFELSSIKDLLCTKRTISENKNIIELLIKEKIIAE